MSFKQTLFIFSFSLISALIFGIVFTFVGYLFANILGFPVSFGTEQIAMEASGAFYGSLATSIGVLVGIRFVTKKMGQALPGLHVVVTTLCLAVGQLFLREYLSLYTLILFAVVSSLILTMVYSYSVTKSS
jgi:hypothetical protein